MKISEMFVSIQGEGINIGQPQLFIRLTGCNIDCDYCDTDTSKFRVLRSEKILELIESEKEKHFFKQISITGGEPLIQAELLKPLLERLKDEYTIMLETNATLPKELEMIIDYIDIVSADLKLGYHSENIELFKEFMDIAIKKETYIKIVYKAKDKEILKKMLPIALKYEVPVYLQPITPFKKEDITLGLDIIDEFKSENLRLLPQIHPYMNIQ
mgnify:CR=1 FL=1